MTTWKSRIPFIMDAVERGAELAIQRAGTAIVAKAREFVPVDTSSLQRSIRLEGPERARGEVTYTVIAGDETAERLGRNEQVDYAAYVEYTVQPYLIPAAMSVSLIAEVQQALRETLK